ENLRKSRPLELAQKGRIAVYGNPVLFEETLRLYFKKKEKLSRAQLDFLLSITNGKWFRPTVELWKRELDITGRNDKYYFIYSVELEIIKKNMKSLRLITELSEEDYNKLYQRIFIDEYQKKKNIKNASL